MQHLLAFADERQMNEALENGQKGGTPVPLRLARLAAHPAAAAEPKAHQGVGAGGVLHPVQYK